MTSSFREKVNAHLPIVLQFISTASLVVLALSAICGSKSLKRMANEHEMHASSNISYGYQISESLDI